MRGTYIAVVLCGLTLLFFTSAHSQSKSQLETIIEKTTDDTVRLEALIERISFEEDTAQINLLIAKVEPLIEEINLDSYRIALLRAQQRSFYERDIKEAIDDLSQIGVAFDSSNAYLGELNYLWAFKNHVFGYNRYADSVRYYASKASDYYQKAQDPLGVSRASTLLFYATGGGGVEATDTELNHYLRQGASTYHLAQENYKKGHYEEALQYYQESNVSYSLIIEEGFRELKRRLDRDEISQFRQKVKEIDSLIITNNLKPSLREYLFMHLFEYTKILDDKGLMGKAMECISQDLQLAEKHNKRKKIAKSLLFQAAMYMTMEFHEEAIAAFLSGLDFAISVGDQDNIAFFKLNLAEEYYDVENYDSALRYARQAFDYFDKINDLQTTSFVGYRLGMTFEKLDMPDSAAYYFQRAKKDALQSNDYETLADLKRREGNEYIKKNQEGKAIKSLEEALALPSKENRLEIIHDITKELYPLYEKTGNYTKAFEILKRYQSSKDSLFNEKNTAAVAKRELEYEYEKEREKQREALSRERLISQQKADRQRWVLMAFILGSVMILVIAVIIYRNYRIKTLANKLLSSQNDQIKKQKKELESLNKVKSQFFANISHELRTPLTLISAPLQDIVESPAKATKEDFAGNIKLIGRSTEQLKKLVNDILDLSKSEAGKMSLLENEIDLHALLKRIWAHYQPFVKLRELKYNLDLKNLDKVRVKIDIIKVEKILSNFISNAIKFCQPGASVSLVASNQRDQLTLYVSDTGAGIKQEDLPYIFDRYYQGDQTEASQYQSSTGIGLALCKEFASLMKGTLSVKSEHGQGATFTLEMPITIVEDNRKETKSPAPASSKRLQDKPPADKSKPKKGRSPKTTTATGKAHILLVEDNIDMHQFIHGLLSEDHQVTSAYNGAVALEKMQETAFDLIVSDYMMPRMNGLEMLENIRKEPLYEHIPIIMLTALDEEKYKLAAFELGVNAYLTKPFSTKEFKSKVKSLLSLSDNYIKSPSSPSERIEEPHTAHS